MTPHRSVLAAEVLAGPRDVAQLCEQRPVGDPRCDAVVVVHLGAARALIGRGSPLTEPFLRRAVAS